MIVSPTALTVAECGERNYTVKLSHEPAQPLYVLLYWEGDDDLTADLPSEQQRVLVPDGWTHHGGEDWSGFAFNWRQGVSITVKAREDGDDDNGSAAIRHLVYTVPALHLGNPPDWAKDPVYENRTGASVKATERDND